MPSLSNIDVRYSVQHERHTGTPVCGLLGCLYPVVARSELVAGVTRAGGFGFLGMVREPAAIIEDETRRVRELVCGDFGVNLIPAATAPPTEQRY
jgi:nitronate monooxygenase